jgi:hypothetical protein
MPQQRPILRRGGGASTRVEGCADTVWRATQENGGESVSASDAVHPRDAI